jgi:ArsR family transcriptional regulator
MNDTSDICEETLVHDGSVQKAAANIPDTEFVQTAAEFFKTLGDPTRIRIITALFAGELCVCDLEAVLNMNQSAVSHQLRTLKQSGFVKNRKDGRTVYYSLRDEHISQIYGIARIHILEKEGDTL